MTVLRVSAVRWTSEDIRTKVSCICEHFYDPRSCIVCAIAMLYDKSIAMHNPWGESLELEASKLLPTEIERWRLSWSVRIAGIQPSWFGLGDTTLPFPL